MMLKMLLCSAIMTRMFIVCIRVVCLVCAVVGATHHLKYSDRSIGIAMLTKESGRLGQLGQLGQ